MVRERLGPDWHARLRARADRPPLAARQPLWWAGARIGSVEPGVPAALALPLLRPAQRGEEQGWEVVGERADAAFEALAEALRDAGYVRAWRHEQVAVHDEAGRCVGTIERGVVRVLGIATHAVHLLGFTDDGCHWVQQRAFDKPNDPGMWDTLVGGMVPAGETVDEALARETWEEAGLRPAQLKDLRAGGTAWTRHPSDEVPAGYVVERLDWYLCGLPDGVVPCNQDGEVAQFRRMAPAELHEHLAAGAFTLEAALMLAAAGCA